MTRAEGNDPVELGSALAKASEAERRHAHPGPSPLGERRYTPSETALHRRVASTLDEQIRTITAGYVGAAIEDREQIRATLTKSDFYTLFSFVRRTTLEAIASYDSEWGELALLALSMVEPERVDARDLAWAIDIAIASINYTGGDAASALTAAAALAPVPASFTERNPAASFRHAGYHIVEGDEPGLIQDDGRPYNPSFDLLAIGRAVSQGFERDSKVTTLRIGSTLPGVWFNLPQREPERAVRGTIVINGVNADHKGGLAPQMFTAFLSEFHAESVAAEYEDLSNAHDASRHVNLTVREGKVLCVLITRAIDPRIEPIESVTSIERMRSGIQDALAVRA